MLTRPNEHDKLGATICLWELVCLVLVARALQVPVEPRECAERQVVSYKKHPYTVPLNESSVAHEIAGTVARSGAGQWASESARRVGDGVVLRVSTNDKAVELFVHHLG